VKYHSNSFLQEATSRIFPLKELILPLNSIQKELNFNKSLERITRYSFGKTRTYLEQSKFLGDPKAIRAVVPPMGKPL
jgi:O6-methylguanine-DNA--protein-cysteine methyltransferase